MRITLNISTREIRLAAIEGSAVRKWGVVQLPAGRVRDGHILQPQAVGTAIASLFKSTGIKHDRVWLTVSGLSFTYRILDMPRIKSSQLEEAVLRAVRREISLPMEELYLTWQVMEKDADTLTVFALGVPRVLVDDIIKTMSVAGIKLAALDLKSLALARAANRTNAVVVDFEPDCYEIVIVTGGIPNILHTVVPRIGTSTAEDNVSRLIDELTRTVNFYNITHADSPLPAHTPLFLTGAISRDEETIRLLQAATDYHIESPAPAFKYPADFPLYLFAPNIGLAMKGRSRAHVPRGAVDTFYDINLDLLAARKKAEREKQHDKSRIVPIGVVVLVLLLVPAFLMRSGAARETARLQTQFDRVTRELMLARIAADTAVQSELTISQLLEEVETLQKERSVLFGGNIDMAADLQAVIDTIAKYGSIVHTEASPDEIIIECRAAQRDDIFNFTHALEMLNRFIEVRIANIDKAEGAGGGGMVFTLVITR